MLPTETGPNRAIEGGTGCWPNVGAEPEREACQGGGISKATRQAILREVMFHAVAGLNTNHAMGVPFSLCFLSKVSFFSQIFANERDIMPTLSVPT